MSDLANAKYCVSVLVLLVIITYPTCTSPWESFTIFVAWSIDFYPPFMWKPVFLFVYNRYYLFGRSLEKNLRLFLLCWNTGRCFPICFHFNFLVLFFSHSSFLLFLYQVLLLLLFLLYHYQMIITSYFLLGENFERDIYIYINIHVQ